MTRNQRWFALGILAILAVIGGYAQQQYSGGSSVTVSAALPTGSNTIGAVKVTDGTNFMPTGDASARSIHTTVDNASLAVTGTFWQSTQPVSLSSLPALAAGTAKVGVTYPYTSCGTTAWTKALQAVPTSSTAVASATTCLLILNLSNTNGSSVTVTVSDNQGTPVNFLNAVTLAAGETRTYAFAPGGASFTSGVKMSASTTGVTYTAEGLQ